MSYALYKTRYKFCYIKVIKIYKQVKYGSLEGYYKSLGYLKRIIDLGLFYYDFPADLEGYYDASWITSSSNNKATSRWIFTLRWGVIYWASKKQTFISHSTMELKLIVMVVVGKETK